MRNDGDPDADGPANLRDAIALAGAGPAPGPVLRIGGVTHHARWVTKTDTSALDTFRSPGAGPDRTGSAAAARRAPSSRGSCRCSRTPASTTPSSTGTSTGAPEGSSSRAPVPATSPARSSTASTRAVAAGVPVVVTSRCWTGAVAPDLRRPRRRLDPGRRRRHRRRRPPDPQGPPRPRRRPRRRPRHRRRAPLVRRPPRPMTDARRARRADPPGAGRVGVARHARRVTAPPTPASSSTTTASPSSTRSWCRREWEPFGAAVDALGRRCGGSC